MYLIQILSTVLFIHQLILWLTKCNPNTLCCGLFCYTGTTTPNIDKLKILALYNQTRGDHATGLCIDDAVFKDTVNAREFLVKHKEFLKQANYNFENNVIIGHCRLATASYAKERLIFAHPHEVKKDGKDFLRLVHNGTITNIQDLAKKYDIDTISKSDSIIIAEIITKTWDKVVVLREYDGAATIIFYDINFPNTLYVHRDIQRELFYWQASDTECYISSIKDSLIAIGADEDQVSEFESGILYKFDGAGISKKWDFKLKTPYTHPKPKSSAPVMDMFNGGKRTYCQQPTDTAKTINTNGFIFGKDHLIRFNGHLYTGEMYVSKDGRLAYKKQQIEEHQLKHYNKFHLIMGLIVKDQQCYNAMWIKCREDKDISPEKFKALFPSELQVYSKYPVLGKTYASNNYLFFWSDELTALKDVDDRYSWTPPLSGKVYSIGRNGYLFNSVDVKSDAQPLEIIDTLVKEKIAKDLKFNSVYELWVAYKTVIQSGFMDFSAMTEQVIKYMESKKVLTIVALKDLKLAHEDYEHETEYMGDAYPIFPAVLNDAFTKVQDYMYISTTVCAKDSDEHTVTDVIDELEAPTTDKDFFKSQDFQNEILFTDYSDLQDLEDTYIVDKDKTNLGEFYNALLNILKRIGLIAVENVEHIRGLDYAAQKSRIAIVYDKLKKNKSIRSIPEIFSNGNTTEGFAKVFDDFRNLDCKPSLSRSEAQEHEILKMAVNYLYKRAKTLDRSELISKYNILETEIEQVCS